MKRRKYFQAIRVREALCEAAFAACVSEQKVNGTFDAIGEALWWLDGIASCRWGCRRGDHEEEHLLSRMSASASAALLLLRSGYFDQASGILRELEEAANLLYLFTHSSKDYQEWRTLDEEGRKNRYSAFNVRLKLEKLNVETGIEKDGYYLLSKYGVHPGPGTEPRPHDSPEEPTVGTAYRPAAGLSTAVAVMSIVVTALLFGNTIVPRADIKQSILDAAITAIEEIGGIDSDALKEEATLVLQPPQIEVTVEFHEDGEDSVSDEAIASSPEI